MPPFHKSSSLPDMQDIRDLLRNNNSILFRSLENNNTQLSSQQHNQLLLQRRTSSSSSSNYLNRSFPSRPSLQNLRDVIDDAIAIVDSDNDDITLLSSLTNHNNNTIRRISSDANIPTFHRYRNNATESNGNMMQPVPSQNIQQQQQQHHAIPPSILEQQEDTTGIHNCHDDLDNDNTNDFFIEESDHDDNDHNVE